MRVVNLKTSIKDKFDFTKMQFLGNGIEAHVYTDGQYAYKYVRYSSNYIKWLFFLRKHKVLNSQHVPKVKYIYVDPHRERCVVKMELLRPLQGKEYEKLHGMYYKVVDLANSKKRHTGMNRVLQNIGVFVNQYGANIDLHAGNFMMRGNKMVVTDPVT